MAKTKRFKAHGLPKQFRARALDKELDQIDDLLAHRQHAKALEKLHQLASRYPRDRDVFAMLFNTAVDTKDSRTMLMAALRLAELEPDDPDIVLSLAGSYMGNIFPALAIATLRDFVARWPNHPRAAESHQTISELKARLSDEWTQSGLPLEYIELAPLHERVQIELTEGRYAEARRLAEKILAQLPTFAAPLNNISLAHFLEGHLPEAIAAARRVLDECDPDNFHALSNLVHYMCLLGKWDEARAYAERLKTVRSDRTDVWVKKAEAFSYLSGDAQVVQIFKEAEQAGMLKPPLADPYLLHLAAAANAFLGNEAEAIRWWKRALQISPAFAPARENLQDLKQPVERRNGPWSLPLTSWLPQVYVQALIDLVEPATRRKKSAGIERAARQFLDKYPGIKSVMPVLLSRGDPPGVLFASSLARMADTPEMQALLKEFALGQHGTDQRRQEAAYALAEAGVLPTHTPVRMWVRGGWTKVLLVPLEITGEPKENLPHHVQQLLGKAMQALQKEEFDEAERLVRQALDKAPDSISISQNLATIYLRRGEIERGEALLRQLVERDADYIIGRCNLAQIATDRGDYNEAEKLLEPVTRQKKIHSFEFAAICQARIQLELARGQRDVAQLWLDMWASVEPDHPGLPYWRAQLKPRSAARSWLDSLHRRNS